MGLGASCRKQHNMRNLRKYVGARRKRALSMQVRYEETGPRIDGHQRWVRFVGVHLRQVLADVGIETVGTWNGALSLRAFLCRDLFLECDLEAMPSTRMNEKAGT